MARVCLFRVTKLSFVFVNCIAASEMVCMFAGTVSLEAVPFFSTEGENMRQNRIVVCLLVVVLFSCCSILSSCSNSDQKDVVSSQYVAHNVSVKEDGEFKILYLTDLHFINSEVTSETVVADYTLRDEWAMTAVTAIVEEADPDMIVVTGDMVFTHNLVKMITQTNDNYAAFKKAADFVDSFGIPWAFTFGNHDEEGSLSKDADEAKAILAEYLRSDSIKHCLFSDGPEEINGCGNYIINVVNRDHSVNTSLVFFDSGSYIKMYRSARGCPNTSSTT